MGKCGRCKHTLSKRNNNICAQKKGTKTHLLHPGDELVDGRELVVGHGVVHQAVVGHLVQHLLEHRLDRQNLELMIREKKGSREHTRDMCYPVSNVSL